MTVSELFSGHGRSRDQRQSQGTSTMSGQGLASAFDKPSLTINTKSSQPGGLAVTLYCSRRLSKPTAVLPLLIPPQMDSSSLVSALTSDSSPSLIAQALCLTLWALDSATTSPSCSETLTAPATNLTPYATCRITVVPRAALKLLTRAPTRHSLTCRYR
ncbi:hypothetical protein Tdes44962_MAKER06164 [Teratosphaeria destructans]|uniref:Uncharacterized protein n=1 Tax=Teratosphaeria destructans TaxID=418781 RepID=A0A9W7SHZ9_9PEZI|nr:hypothetical protein Tdes44962_MAKER06164 [Teratosphaeria destructans]